MLNNIFLQNWHQYFQERARFKEIAGRWQCRGNLKEVHGRAHLSDANKVRRYK